MHPHISQHIVMHVVVVSTLRNVLHQGLSKHSIWSMIFRWVRIVQNASQNVVQSKSSACSHLQMWLLVLSSPRIMICGNMLLSSGHFLAIGLQKSQLELDYTNTLTRLTFGVQWKCPFFLVLLPEFHKCFLPCCQHTSGATFLCRLFTCTCNVVVCIFVCFLVYSWLYGGLLL